MNNYPPPLFVHNILLLLLQLVLWQAPAHSRSFYISAGGNDNGDGSLTHPWQTIQQLNRIHLNEGDKIFFNGGDSFEGTIMIDSSETGSVSQPLIFSSYGKGKALIFSKENSGLRMYNASYVKINNLIFKGMGRKSGNTKDGLVILNCRQITLDNIDISGYQKAGLQIFASAHISARHINSKENGYAGISVEGNYGTYNASHIYIGYCKAENNPGDPSNLTNHSGNGIVAGYCKNVTIEYCAATNNGWDMPRQGNGPVGIWAYEADSVLIRHCVSYKNKTSKGGDDGGGFDLDGGVTNSIIECCLSYGNQGSGFGIFQYAGAGKWYNNIVRNNISENDGAVSAAQAGVYIWNSSGDEKQFKDLLFANNIIYNSKVAAISYASQSRNSGFQFHDNILVGRNEIIRGKELPGDGIFMGNDWWSLEKGFNVDGITRFKDWVKKTGKEQKSGKITGLNEQPVFKNPGNSHLTLPSQLTFFTNYHLLKNTSLQQKMKIGLPCSNTDY